MSMNNSKPSETPNRRTISDVPSGKIELVFDGEMQLLQFNCSCDDALPYCRAVCCRNRPYFNVLLEPEEVQKFKSMPHPQHVNLLILQEDGSRCIYLDNNTCHCAVHSDKPKICTRYHCSPGGSGDGIDLRGNGWMLLPRDGNLQGVELQPPT